MDVPHGGTFKHVLVVVCSYTKALTNIRARGVIHVLTDIFVRFGQPGLFISYNGTEFRNRAVQAFLREWGVAYRYPAPYNLQANGQAESAIKILAEILFKMRRNGNQNAHVRTGCAPSSEKRRITRVKVK